MAQWANLSFFCGCFSLSVSRWSWVPLQTALPSRLLASWLCQSCPEKAELQLRHSWARLNCSFCLHCLSFPLAVHFPCIPLVHFRTSKPFEMILLAHRETTSGSHQKARLNLSEAYGQERTKVKLFALKKCEADCCSLLQTRFYLETHTQIRSCKIP